MYDYASHGNIDFSDTEPPKHDFGDVVVRVIRTRDIYQVDPEEHGRVLRANCRIGRRP
ncbi:MAG: hypothetical protein ACLRX5_02275 [Slackia sp.]